MNRRDNRYRGVTVSLVFFSVLFHILSWAERADAQEIAERRYAVHHKGLQWLGMDNRGVLGNPDNDSLWIPELEYIGGTATTFIFAGGLWVGALKEGIPIVSTCFDGDNGTREFGGLEFAVPKDLHHRDIGSIGWLEKGVAGYSEEDQAYLLYSRESFHGRYLGLGKAGQDDDGDGLIDEDPAGDISHDYVDNDADGLVDEEDPDLDGDVVPGNRDDDGDGLVDEDDCAVATQEFITAYVDTCRGCMDPRYDDIDGFTPLGIRVVQHSYQWDALYADDFIIFDYEITNIGGTLLEDVAVGFFMDFYVKHPSDPWRSRPHYSRLNDSFHMAIGGCYDLIHGLLSASTFGLVMLQPWENAGLISYTNYDRLTNGDPPDNVTKYQTMVSGLHDPDCCAAIDIRFIISIGPIGDMAPGETLHATFAVVNGVFEPELISNACLARNMEKCGFAGPSSPDPPEFSLETMNHGIGVKWRARSENCSDRITQDRDFQGYNIWRNEDGDRWTLVATYDLPDTIGMNAGWPPRECSEEGFEYEYEDVGLMNGQAYRYVVTAFDDGDNGDGIHTPAWDERNGSTGVLESSRELAQSVVPAGSMAGPGEVEGVYVVPNPYCGSWVLERGGESDRIDFRGLPPACEITIHTLSGDEVRRIRHDNGLSWEAWDLANEDGREVSGGIYLFHVESEGNERIGKFVVVR